MLKVERRTVQLESVLVQTRRDGPLRTSVYWLHLYSKHAWARAYQGKH